MGMAGARYAMCESTFIAPMQLPQLGLCATGTASGLLQDRDCHSVMSQTQMTNRLNERVNKTWLLNNRLV